MSSAKHAGRDSSEFVVYEHQSFSNHMKKTTVSNTEYGIISVSDTPKESEEQNTLNEKKMAVNIQKKQGKNTQVK